MADPRHEKLAQVLIHYSLAVQPGEKLLIIAPPLAAPLVREAYRTAIRAGALITTRIALDGLQEIRLREGNDAQVSYVPPSDVEDVERCDVLLSIQASENTRALSGIDPQRLAAGQQARQGYGRTVMERASTGALRWVGTLFPTQAAAQDAGMSLSEYENFVYGAGLLDEPDTAATWRKVEAEQQRIADFLMQHDEIRIVAPNTDLTYRVGGRTWINASGQRNFPDGEVFTGPIEDSANGVVTFTYPAVYGGNEVENVRLTFRDGKVVEASADRGQDFLISMLDQDAGARFLGEVAFGLNYGIQRFSRNILFDEKIGGTMHMALGASYPDTGGKNQSGLHWDMVCDLRQGQVYADGKQCYSEGRFTI